MLELVLIFCVKTEAGLDCWTEVVPELVPHERCVEIGEFIIDGFSEVDYLQLATFTCRDKGEPV